MAGEFEAEKADRCVWCGSRRIVTSITEVREGRLRELGWICKRCYDKISGADKAGRYVFGYEGWVDESRTVWDVKAEGGEGEG